MQHLSSKTSQHRPQNHESEEIPAESIALGHMADTLWRYRLVIMLGLSAVMLAYGLLAIVVYLRAPRQMIITLPFRLEFKGAERGEYPNGTKFSASEIVATPTLKRVFQANQLGRFTTFDRFSDSVFIVEYNEALEQLSRHYQSRFADPKLNPVDRDRLEKEYAQKRESLSRSEFAINFVVKEPTAKIPPTLIQKSLTDTLSQWAESAAQEKGVLKYRIPVLTKNVLNREILNARDYVIALDILRTRIDSVVRNIDDLLSVPGAEVIRTGDEQVSLTEIRLKLADVVRFKVQPLLMQVRSSNASPDPRVTLNFLQSQLNYNEHQSKAAEARANALRDSLNIYTQQRRSAEISTDSRTIPQRDGETVMPQINESFIDRLIALTKEKSDIEYRQDLVNRITVASMDILPFQQEAAYYRQLIDQMKGIGSTTLRINEATTIHDQLENAFQDVALAIEQVNGIYGQISRNLNPSTVLYTITSPPVGRVERSVSLTRLALYGILVLLISIPLISIACLLHNRIREEQELENGILPEPQRVNSAHESPPPHFPERETRDLSR